MGTGIKKRLVSRKIVAFLFISIGGISVGINHFLSGDIIEKIFVMVGFALIIRGISILISDYRAERRNLLVIFLTVCLGISIVLPILILLRYFGVF